MLQSITRSGWRQRMFAASPKLTQVPRNVRAGSPRIAAVVPNSWRTLALALIAPVLAALAFVAPAQAAPLSPADQAFVDTTVADALRANPGGQMGMAISLRGPAGDYARAYGYANNTSRTALTLNDHFRIGSVTKTFTATSVLRLIEAGRLSFSDTVDRFIPRIPNGSTMTVRHLLSMQDGLFDYQQDSGLRVTFGLTPWNAIEPEQIIAVLQNPANRPLFAPGTRTQYSESAYFVLGKILEVVTGRDAEAYITDDVITPLGLTNSKFPSAANSSPIYAMPAPYATGYAASAIFPGTTQDVTATNPNFAWTSGAIISTVGDLEKYARELGTGALIRAATQTDRLSFCPIPYSGEGPTAFGYGLGMMSFGSWIGHGGSWAGNNAVAWYEPTSGATFGGAENYVGGTVPVKVWQQVFTRIAERLYPGSMATPRYPTC
ncbi:beta-lactamase [Conexibacter woesei DSM 14684]|uniref:Beta-lactamase n=1 Tax=Conexibacter woesei (strain DSM 14684 / CCUG 47730 / CIP 108061 / JCM 11494 / NBRC 100937 / ID131577) TaxID=469383 RepID=D3F7V0_CONWI|nr:beta-lactamase [Conexibacter woesei DSM 14684]